MISPPILSTMETHTFGKTEKKVQFTEGDPISVFGVAINKPAQQKQLVELLKGRIGTDAWRGSCLIGTFKGRTPDPTKPQFYRINFPADASHPAVDVDLHLQNNVWIKAYEILQTRSAAPLRIAGPSTPPTRIHVPMPPQLPSTDVAADGDVQPQHEQNQRNEPPNESSAHIPRPNHLQQVAPIHASASTQIAPGSSPQTLNGNEDEGMLSTDEEEVEENPDAEPSSDEDAPAQPSPNNVCDLPTRDTLKSVNGKQWRELHETDRLAEEDLRGQNANEKEPTLKPKVKSKRNADGQDWSIPSAYCNAFVPEELVNNMAKWTTQRMKKEKSSAPPVTVRDIKFFLYLLVAMSPYSGGVGLDYFWTESVDPDLFPSPNFGRFMSRDRFNVIKQYLTFWNPDTVDPSDPLYEVRYLYDVFNRHTLATVDPGWILVIDESIFKNTQSDADRKSKGIPKGAFKLMPAKPKNGFMNKSIACGISGVVLILELQEGVEEMKAKKFAKAPDNIQHTTAVTLRLLEPFFWTWRTLVGDSWFTSVTTVWELLKRGMYYCGVLKTNTKGSPAKWMERNAFDENSPRGASTMLFMDLEEQFQNMRHTNIACMAYNEPTPKMVARRNEVRRQKKRKIQKCKPRLYLTSAFSMKPGQPWRRVRTKMTRNRVVPEKFAVEIPQTVLHEKAHAYLNVIDKHDQRRQAYLNLESVWKTKDWKMRVFTGIFGTMLVNANVAYNHWEEKDMSTLDFARAASIGILKSPQNEQQCLTRAAKRRQEEEAQRSPAKSPIPHEPVPAYEVTGELHRRRLKGTCQLCSAVAYKACRECSTTKRRHDGTMKVMPYFLCGEQTQRRCGKIHLLDNMANNSGDNSMDK